MSNRFTPLQSQRKRLRSLFQLRAASRRNRERLPFSFLLEGWRRRRAEAAMADWEGGYILLDDGSFAYVPRELDVNGHNLLTRKIATESVIARHCPPGGVALDVGAHLGTWTLPMARAVGETGRVYAFEPVPFLRQAVRKTALANGLRQIVTDGRALGAAPGPSDFTVAGGDDTVYHSGHSCLGRRPIGGQVIEVEVTTLDAFAEELKLERLDFIKVDVEGFEVQVLAGGAGTLGRLHPAIVFETGLEERAQRLTIRETLGPLGYRLIGIPVEHGIVEADWDAFVEFSTPFTAAQFCDVLCVRE